MEPRVFTVTQLNKYLRGLFRQDETLQDIWVSGEISNYYHHDSGHCYFTLKDKQSSMRAVLFKSNARLLKFNLENGLEVIARGHIDIYEPRGEYQLYVQSMEPAGIGALHLAFEQLKQKLEQEGLFDERHKKNLPLIPRCVGIVTSPSGAAVKDVISVLKRRFSGLSLLIAPARVQGEGAKKEIIRGLQLLQKEGVDVIIITRGGGSLEELWPFNEEEVARAVFACPIPVISAVGHERDYTITDFVADLRAPTPSAAAELVTKPQADIESELHKAKSRLLKTAESLITQNRLTLKSLVERRILRQPQEYFQQMRQQIDDAERRMGREIVNRARMYREVLAAKAGRLNGLNPLGVLARGYCICRDPKTQEIFKQASSFNLEQKVELVFSSGRAGARIIDIEEGEIV